VIILIVVVLIYYADSSIKDIAVTRYENLYYSASSEQSYASYEDRNITFRKDHAQYLFAAFKQYPVFGRGYGTWPDIYSEHGNIIGYGLAPHSGILLTLAELGMVGVILLVIVTKQTALKTIEYDSNTYVAYVSKYSAYAIFAMYVFSIGGDAIRQAEMYLLWGISVGSMLKQARTGKLGADVSPGIAKSLHRITLNEQSENGES